jgi:hypothetical protein
MDASNAPLGSRTLEEFVNILLGVDNLDFPRCLEFSMFDDKDFVVMWTLLYDNLVVNGVDSCRDLK